MENPKKLALLVHLIATVSCSYLSNRFILEEIKSMHRDKTD